MSVTDYEPEEAMIDDHDQSFTSSSFSIKYSDEHVETSD